MCNLISKIFKRIYNIFCYFPICIKITCSFSVKER